MYYSIVNGEICKAEEHDFWECDNSICVLKLPDWNEGHRLRDKAGIWHRAGQIHFCKMETHADYMFATFRVPSKVKGNRDIIFAIYITQKRIIILDDDGETQEAVKKLVTGSMRKNYTLWRFLYDFLLLFVNEDLIFLEKLERDIAVIEEDVLDGRAEKFSYSMLYLKKIIARFYHYYTQLKVVGDELSANENNFFSNKDIRMFDMFSDKMERLADETQLLREYAMQVQEVYQAEIEIKQNDVMKMLTIVTTIFLPLTLIVGWYGMNFEYMPELKYRYSYPIVVFASLLIVFASLFYFKKKRFL